MKVHARVHNKSLVLLSAFFLLTTTLACGLFTQQPSTKPLSEADYKAACKPMLVGQLTQNADSEKGHLVKITGKILVYEETQGDDFITRIIIAVDDETFTFPSGQLPVYVRYLGRIDSFINDTVTIYGEVYGSDDYQIAPNQEKDITQSGCGVYRKSPVNRIDRFG